MQLRETPAFNSVSSGFGGPIRVPLANNVVNQPRLLSTGGRSASRIPSNLNYNINQPKSQSINRIQNNIPNPYIKPNQPGIITATLGQNISPVYANSNNIGILNGPPRIQIPDRPIIRQVPPQFNQQAPPHFNSQIPPNLTPPMIGYAMGPPPIAHGPFSGLSMRTALGTQFTAPYGSRANPAPTYIGYKLLTDKQSIPKQTSFSKVDMSIQSSKIYCVICQQQYHIQNKDQHIRKHQRNGRQSNKIKNLIKQYKQQHTDLKLRPIVQPQQYNIQYTPNQFVIHQQTSFSTPVLEPVARSQLGVCTNDLVITNQNQNIVRNTSENLSPVQISGLSSTVVQPQQVRLTGEGQHISYVDPNAFHGQRIFRQTSTNQNIQLNQNYNNDSRFTRNTFVNDEPSPVYKPVNQTLIINKQPLHSIQSVTYHTQNQPLNSNDNPNTLPIRDTVVSLDYQDSNYQITQSRTYNQPNLISPKILATHQPVMSPIRQQTQNRITNSQVNFDDYHDNQLQANNRTTQLRQTAYITPNSASIQQGLFRNSTNPSRSSQFNQQYAPVQIGSTSNNQTQYSQKHQLIDQFNMNQQVIPRQTTRNTNIKNNQITIQAIVQERLGQQY